VSQVARRQTPYTTEDYLDMVFGTGEHIPVKLFTPLLSPKAKNRYELKTGEFRLVVVPDKETGDEVYIALYKGGRLVAAAEDAGVLRELFKIYMALYRHGLGPGVLEDVAIIARRAGDRRLAEGLEAAAELFEAAGDPRAHKSKIKAALAFYQAAASAGYVKDSEWF